ncbi:hypothetical protein N7G274_006477 [Stereocaulon virgatum]|uniref:Uncharacterized protein n=1 Tax=Stereocaulon virgatum TaxID=373712 RepID=A0ABR4A696_9LECA
MATDQEAASGLQDEIMDENPQSPFTALQETNRLLKEELREEKQVKNIYQDQGLRLQTEHNIVQEQPRLLRENSEHIQRIIDLLDPRINTSSNTAIPTLPLPSPSPSSDPQASTSSVDHTPFPTGLYQKRALTPKHPDPDKYDGSSHEKLEQFESQLLIKLNVNADHYDMPHQPKDKWEQNRMLYTYSRLEGKASSMIRPFITKQGVRGQPRVKS